MVNTKDILREQEEASQAAQAAKPVASDQKLDDVMLAMDVVDTLRHERFMLEKELGSEARREALIERLRAIYQAQGISVPDDVLMDGVLALEDQRFVYVPPADGLSTSMARIYVNRRKWLPIFYIISFIFIAAFAINYVGFERPQKLEAKRIETLLSETLPDNLSEAHQQAVTLANSDTIKERANNILALGQDAIATRDISKARSYTDNLNSLARELSQTYTVRVVSRPGEHSGVFRINDDGGTEVRNYYLIVEGQTPSGELAKVTIFSEENQTSRQTTIWGVRVPQQVFNRVAADKQDDQIIQNATIGTKKRGYLEPEYTIATSGGKILDW